MKVGDRVTWVHEVGKKRCLLIEAELSGTITGIQGDDCTIAVDSYDGHTVPTFDVTLNRSVING